MHRLTTFPKTSRNALPVARRSRHSLDQRTLHKLVQRKTGLCTLHNWQEELGLKAEKTCLHNCCIIGGSSNPLFTLLVENLGIRISSRNNERSNKTKGKWKIQQTFQDWFCIKTLFYLRKKITTSFGYNTKIQNPRHYF